MSLSQLTEEYRQTAQLLEDRLAQLKEELKTARGEHAFSLQKRVELLYDELLDTRIIIRYLKNYYS